MATVEASTTVTDTGSAWRTEQHSAVTDKALSDFPLHPTDDQLTACEPTEL